MKYFTLLIATLFIFSSCKKNSMECQTNQNPDYLFTGNTLLNGQDWNPENVVLNQENGSYQIRMTKCADYPLPTLIEISNLILNDTIDFSQASSAQKPTIELSRIADQSTPSCYLTLNTDTTGFVRFHSLNDTLFHLELQGFLIQPLPDQVNLCEGLYLGEDTLAINLESSISRFE